MEKSNNEKQEEKKPEEKKEKKQKVDNPLQRSIWVSNLSPNLTEEQLQEFFEYCGEIKEMKMELDPVTYHIKYLIQFAEISQAKVASLLKGTELLGLPLQTCIATTQLEPNTLENLPNNAKQLIHLTDKLSEEHKKDISRTIFVYNLPKDVTTIQLVDLFCKAGPMCYIRVTPDDQSSRHAFIEFLDEISAKKAILFSGLRLGNQNIFVYPSKHAINKPYLKLPYKEKDELAYMTHSLRKKVKKSHPEKFDESERDFSKSPSKTRSESNERSNAWDNDEDMVF
eukprot:gene1320-11403_t